MKATVLVENTTLEGLEEEWGLSILIEYDGNKILLDTGKSEKFLENAKKLGISLDEVDFGVLSHAHYDHADGMGVFFEENQHAKFYLRKECAENCYKKLKISHKYIGIRKGILSEYKDRIYYVDGILQVVKGCYLVPHSLDCSFRVNKMRIKKNHVWYKDLFLHEQSLVFDTQEGLVIFSSCSHTGIDHVIKEAQMALPNRPIYAIIGGFHLFEREDDEVRRLAKSLLQSGVKQVYSGHCTGERALEILEEELGDIMGRMKTGLIMEF